MGCKECGKPKCNGKCGCKSPKVLQINNPAEYITFHKVSIPAAMGDSTTNPPRIGAYRNALVYYEADHTSWMYSTDGIPTLVTGEQGPTGPQGPAGTIAVGTTITGEPGADAEVENVGTPENAIFNFTIPRGEQGDQGIQGEPGPQGYMNEQDVRDVVDTIIPEGFFTDTSKTVSGEGTSITLNDTANAIFKDIKLYGDTEQASYEGKNLFNADTETLVFIDSSGNIIAGSTWSCSDYIKVSPNTTFTWHGEQTGSLGGQVIWAGYDSSQAFISGQYAQVNNTTGTSFTTGASTEYVRVGYRNDRLENMQLELGSTATDYEPYVGRKASPSPEYPQPIQTVTGTQTVSVNGTNYTLDLGDIKLCGLGDDGNGNPLYKDYIYPDGDDWKVHKVIGKAILPDDIDGNNYGYRDGKGWAIQVTTGKPISGGDGDGAGMMYSDKLQSGSRNQIYGGTLNIVAPPSSGAYFLDMFMNPDAATGQGWGNSQFYAWLEENPITVYYIRATAVEEEITDIALISQLEELREAKSNEGTTIITISGSLTATLSVAAFKNGWTGTISGINAGIDNKADKWLVEQKPFYFNSVAEMKAYNLNDGDLAITTGYYSANDGGGARYTITAKQLTADDAFVIELSNGAYAKLVIENNQVNIRQLGARSQDTNNTKYDIAPYINKYMATAKTSYAFDANKISLYIPSGVWYSSPLEISGLGYSIIGDEQFVDWWNRGTIISSILNNQDYIFKFSNSVNFVLKNIIFSTADFTYNQAINSFITNAASVKSIGSYCVRFEKMSYGDTDNLYFHHITGEAFEIASSWEIRYRKLFFRQIDSHNGCIMKFAEQVEGETGGVNASSFDNMMFEAVLGNLMEVESTCQLYNCYFGIINFEDNRHFGREYITATSFTDDNIDDFENSNPEHFAVFYIGEGDTRMATCVIDTIQLNNISSVFYTVDNTNYCHDNIFRVVGEGETVEVIVNNIDSLGIRKDATILYSQGAVHYQSSFILNNLSSLYHNNKEFVFDVDKFTYIRADGRIRAITDSIVPRLTNSATPAYMNVDNRENRGNLLKSDRAALNEIGLCVNLSTYYGAFSFYKASGKLYLNAKVPSGQTAKVFLNSGTAQTVDIVGTGSFEVYGIDLDANNAIGDVIHVSLANENTADYCLVDYFIN